MTMKPDVIYIARPFALAVNNDVAYKTAFITLDSGGRLSRSVNK